MENLIDNRATISIPEFSPSGSLHGLPHVVTAAAPTEEDKKHIAEKAMNEYFDQYDGSDTFLGFMT
jgi:hypothetical protein